MPEPKQIGAQHDPDYVFEQAQPADAQEVFCLYRAAAAHGVLHGNSCWDDDYPNRESIAFDLNNSGLFVMREGGAIIAAVSLMETDDLDEADLPWTPAKSCVLARLCVLPEWQGRGLGACMMDAVSAQARTLGYESTRHLSDCVNPTTTHMYRKMGYRQVGQVHLYGRDFFAFERML